MRQHSYEIIHQDKLSDFACLERRKQGLVHVMALLVFTLDALNSRPTVRLDEFCLSVKRKCKNYAFSRIKKTDESSMFTFLMGKLLAETLSN